MLPHLNRLTSKADFSRLFKNGRIFHSRGISAKILKNGLNYSRFGFVISAKVSKKAVLRNKARRRMREVVGKRLPLVRGGFDVAVLARKEITEMEFRELEASLEYLLIKAGLLDAKR